jgi:hypothetical protein
LPRRDSGVTYVMMKVDWHSRECRQAGMLAAPVN